MKRGVIELEPVHIGDATLYHADCMDILPTLSGVDCVITDPPYGISHPRNFHERGRDKLASCNDYPDVHDDDKPFDPSPFLPIAPCLFWGANHFADKLPPSGGWLVWDKMRPDSLDQSTCELAWTNFVKGVRRIRHLWNGMMRDSERGENYHPTQKPVQVIMWALQFKWCPEGTVFDPYMGAGPTGVACARLGRKFIGIEIEKKYFDIACERIDREYAQGKLFQSGDT